MKYSNLFSTKCVICAQRSYEWAVRPPLWESDRCWNHLRLDERQAWKNMLLNCLHTTKSLENPKTDFLDFKERYLKTERARNVLKMHGYDKYLLEKIEVSGFLELEESLRRLTKKRIKANPYETMKGKHLDGFKKDLNYSIATILREDWLKQKRKQFVSLQDVDLSGEDMSGCRLKFILFNGANLSNSKFMGSILAGSIFNSTDVSNARLDKAEISSCSFEDADLTGSSLLGTHGERVCFRKAKIKGCNARSSNFVKADFSGVELSDIDFTTARLQHSDFSNSKLFKCSFEGAQMLEANFTNAKLIETKFHDVNCANGVFINSEFSKLDLRNGNFSSADFTGCQLEKAMFCDSDLEGANVAGANLRFADLRNTNLRKVDLYKANLEKTKVYLENVQFSGVLTSQLKDGSLLIERMNKIRVFISYSHDDSNFALRLENALKARSIDVWIDSQEILPGDSLIKKIREGIDSSQYVCALISGTSIISPWVQNELDIAMTQQIENRKVKVIPLVLEENLTLPSFLVGKLYVDFSKPEYFEQGISQIERRLYASQ